MFLVLVRIEKIFREENNRTVKKQTKSRKLKEVGELGWRICYF